MTNILFVCTGNIFRSVTAEYALRKAIDDSQHISVSSAGTMHAPEAKVRDDVAMYLRTKSLDVAGHQRRTLTMEILSQAELIISMSTNQHSILRREFETTSLLFTEACGGRAEPLHDVDDLFAPDDRHSPAAQEHIYKIIDKIVGLTPKLAKRLASGWDGSQ